jgi:adenylate kinase
MKVIIFLGAPGSGKGTQSDLLVSSKNFVKISTGDLLREVSSDGSEFGNMIKAIMQAGELVSDEIVEKLLVEKLNKVNNNNANIIFDGFPRTIAQAKMLNNIISNLNGNVEVNVLLLKIDVESVVQRIVGRFNCHDCKENYHDQFKKTTIQGVCDVCGSSKLERREDDNRETITKRLESFENQIAPILSYYKEIGEITEIIAKNHYNDVFLEITNRLDL